MEHGAWSKLLACIRDGRDGEVSGRRGLQPFVPGLYAMGLTTHIKMIAGESQASLC